MAFYYKIGLLVLKQAATKFLVCEKAPEHVTSDYIMPGGRLEEDNDLECLRNEIKEELNCQIDESSLAVIGEYQDVAAGRPDRQVQIKLYHGRLIGTPKPSTEIKYLHWIGKADATNPRVSPIIRREIIPNPVARRILK